MTLSSMAMANMQFTKILSALPKPTRRTDESKSIPHLTEMNMLVRICGMFEVFQGDFLLVRVIFVQTLV